jgi:Cu-Zn family superoxide dismutase
MRQNHWSLLKICGAAVLLAIACARPEPAEDKEMATHEVQPAPTPAPELRAVARLAGPEGSTVSGTVTFAEANGTVTVSGHVEGATPSGEHGFHVHETGDCSAPDFSSAGGHFNPTGTPHAGPADAERHAGDLGNITIGEEGTGHLELTTDLLTVAEGPNSVVGKAVILHEKRDDLVSQPTGDAGGRVACGVVELEGDAMEKPMGDAMDKVMDEKMDESMDKPMDAGMEKKMDEPAAGGTGGH